MDTASLFLSSAIPYDILDVMNRHENVCKYIDIALQHCSDKVLANMRRHITGEETRLLLDTIRRKVPGIHIRTTIDGRISRRRRSRV